MVKLLMISCVSILLFASFAKSGLLHRPKRSESALDLENYRTNNEEGLSDGNGSSELPYCFETEPCQFVFVKKNPRDLKPLKKTVPSWCQCSESETCVQTMYDRRRKMEIYRCQSQGQQLQSQPQRSAPERRRRHHHGEYDLPAWLQAYGQTLFR